MSGDYLDHLLNLWRDNMRRGEFEATWQLSDALLDKGYGKPWVWDGSSPKGKRVLVRCNHGLGDTIQFIRYAPLLKAIASEVIVWAQPPLIPLLETARGIDLLLPLHDGDPEVEYDIDVEVMELPHVFRTALSTIPSEVPYFHVEPAPLPPDETLRVGVCWRAGGQDHSRSIPFPLLARLAEIPGITWYIHQRGEGLAERDEGFGVIQVFHDLLEEARAMRSLDLLISVDTMPAHLAGALAVPVWALLQRDADWRWMEARDDSPWYPTMRLFRQQRRGGWGPVIARVASELEKLSARGQFNQCQKKR
jgi:hypothetical protein